MYRCLYVYVYIICAYIYLRLKFNRLKLNWMYKLIAYNKQPFCMFTIATYEHWL